MSHLQLGEEVGVLGGVSQRLSSTRVLWWREVFRRGKMREEKEKNGGKGRKASRKPPACALLGWSGCGSAAACITRLHALLPRSLLADPDPIAEQLAKVTQNNKDNETAVNCQMVYEPTNHPIHSIWTRLS